MKVFQQKVPGERGYGRYVRQSPGSLWSLEKIKKKVVILHTPPPPPSDMASPFLWAKGGEKLPKESKELHMLQQTRTSLWRFRV